MAEGMLGGFLGDEEEKPEVESPEALAGAEAFASAVAAKLAGSDPGVARKTEEFLSAQTELLRVQKEHLKDEHEARLHFLRGQAREVDIRRFGLHLRVGFQLFLAFVATAIGLGLVVMVYDAFHSRNVIIHSFDISPGLATTNPGGKIVAASLLDRLTQLQAATRITADKRGLSNAWTNEIAIEVPETGLSVGQIENLLKARFGHDEHIDGDLTMKDTAGLTLTVRGTHILPKAFTDQSGRIESLVNAAAEYVYGESEPGLFAKYLDDESRFDEAIAFAKSHLGRVTRDEQPILLNYWANALEDRAGINGDAEAVALFREALRLKPDYWNAYNNLMLTLFNLGNVEETIRLGERMITVAGGRPGKAPESFYEVYDSTVENLQATRAEQLADMEISGGGTLTTMSGAEGLQVAWEDALLHEPDTARLRLRTTVWDQNSPADVALASLTEALLAGELGDFASAASAWDVFAKAYSDPAVAAQNTPIICYAAPTYEKTGQSRKADAALNAIGAITHPDCYRYRADVLDLRGDWAGAQEWYLKAIKLAPSYPDGYYAWGLALGKHNDLKRAEEQFRLANLKGPHWANPLKAWGDVLEKQGNAKGALAKYEEGLKYAPNWKQLREAREALVKSIG
jgi:tetratricopeptide (TPR) repeat protein